MTDEKRIVSIDAGLDVRLGLYDQINIRMKEFGFNINGDYNSLGLGFDLPANWPVDRNAQPTLSQLVVVARRLKMRIVISSVSLLPIKTEEHEREGG